MRILLLVSLLFIVPAYAADIFQCVDEKGRKTFSQRPCGDNSKAQTIQAPELMGTVAPDKSAIDGLEANNRIREIDRLIKSKQSTVDDLNRQMGKEVGALKYQRRFAANNLAGAQWEQSLATEMQAVTQRYKVEIEVLQVEIKQLREERLKQMKR